MPAIDNTVKSQKLELIGAETTSNYTELIYCVAVPYFFDKYDSLEALEIEQNIEDYYDNRTHYTISQSTV